MAKRKNKITLKVNVKKPWEVGRGHYQPRPSAGVHQDKRTKRVRTRSAIKRKILEN